jgi:Holliday junction DNA helicase RuvA
LHTYTLIENKPLDTILYTHQVIKEDAHSLFAFAGKDERDLFRHLITVSGIGANTARVMLSSLSPDEIRQAILTQNVGALTGVKGIGAKSAQRIILDLKDKIGKDEKSSEILIPQDNRNREEALSALVTLGFNKKQVEKTISKLLQDDPGATVEELIKKALKIL